MGPTGSKTHFFVPIEWRTFIHGSVQVELEVPSPARGSRGAAKRHLVDGGRESEISRAWFSGKTPDHGGARGAGRLPDVALERPPVRPWCGAGGEGGLQVRRVVNRRNG